jgi:hypothetical protein
MDIAAWLHCLDLERHAPAFRDHEIDWDVLPKLSADDLRDLGAVLGGHRRRLLEAIAALDAKASARAGRGRSACRCARGTRRPAPSTRNQVRPSWDGKIWQRELVEHERGCRAENTLVIAIEALRPERYGHILGRVSERRRLSRLRARHGFGWWADDGAH